jgi:ABC-type dipeptide/oligopeptide/nickel transport system permease subunit
MNTQVLRAPNEFEKAEKSSMLKEILTRMVKSPSAKLGCIILIMMILVCVAAPLLTPYHPTDMDFANMFRAPCKAHPCGTDAYGRDILCRLLYGGRYSLVLGASASIVSALLGIVIGCVAGYFGGTVETIIMRLMDVWSALPSILLSIIISAVLGPGFLNTILALSVGGVPSGVRLIRGQILSERSKEYLEAAESINCSKLSIMFKHLLPNVISPMIVSTTMSVGNYITSAASLSFIDLGVRPPTPEWGAMLSAARGHMLSYPYMIMFPGIFIALTVLSVNLMGDGLRDALDPKLRS